MTSCRTSPEVLSLQSQEAASITEASWTKTPTKTSTSLPIPTFTATEARIVNPTSTPTPAPTLLPEESQKKFQEWLQGSEECRLPCWAGITPGETTWEQARRMIERVLIVGNVYENHEYLGNSFNGFSWRFPFAYHEYVVDGSIIEKNSDVVTEISARIGTSEYQMPIDQIFSEYGLPERILIFAVQDVRDGFVEHWIILSYPNNNFIVRYYRMASMKGDNFWSCGLIDYTDLRIVYELDPVWDNKTILTLLGLRYVEGESEFFPRVYPLEDVTEFTLESFVDMFLNDPSACFEIIIEN
jgi:hypothetical protein